MDWELIIIDGYSLLHRDIRSLAMLDSNLTIARNILYRKVEQVAGIWSARITLVFDGKHDRVDNSNFESSVIETVFSSKHLTADTVIEQMVVKHPNPDKVLVVSSDRLECITVSAAGAHTISCSEFLENISRIRINIKQNLQNKSKENIQNSLGFYFPEEERNKNE